MKLLSFYVIIKIHSKNRKRGEEPLGNAILAALLVVLAALGILSRCWEKLPLKTTGWVRKIPICLREGVQEAHADVTESAVLLLAGKKAAIPRHWHRDGEWEKYYEFIVEWNAKKRRFKISIELIDTCRAGDSHKLSPSGSLFRVILAIKGM